MTPVRGLAGFTLGLLVAACSDTGGPAPASAPGSWSTLDPLPTARQEMPSALIGGRTHTPGGYNAGGTASQVLEVYDIETDGWSAGPPMPEARHHPGVAALGGQLYVTGGYSNAGPSAAVFAFDPPLSAGPPGSPCRQPGPHTSVSNRAVFPHTEEFDPATNTWRRLADLPTPRHGMGAVTVADAIHVIGGGIRAGFGAAPTHEVFRLR